MLLTNLSHDIKSQEHTQLGHVDRRTIVEC